jgi:hypothetical protein
VNQSSDESLSSFSENHLNQSSDNSLFSLSLFRPENANEWLFLPLNEYAEYTDLVPDYK